MRFRGVVLGGVCVLIDVVPLCFVWLRAVSILSWSDSTSVSLVSQFVIDASSYAVVSWSWCLLVLDSVFMLMVLHTLVSCSTLQLWASVDASNKRAAVILQLFVTMPVHVLVRCLFDIAVLLVSETCPFST